MERHIFPYIHVHSWYLVGWHHYSLPELRMYIKPFHIVKIYRNIVILWLDGVEGTFVVPRTVQRTPQLQAHKVTSL